MTLSRLWTFRAVLLGILALTVLLIAEPFYDAANLNAWIAFGSTFHNAYPTFQGSPWPGGPFTTAFLLPLSWSYIASGFDLLAALITFKIILFLFTLGTAYQFYALLKTSRPDTARLLFLFTLANPAILVINYIWAQVDIIPVYLTLLSFSILRLAPVSNRPFVNDGLAMVPFFVAVFFYLYPLILLPTLLIYSSDNMRRLSLALWSTILGGGLLVTAQLLFRGAAYNYLGAATGAAINSRVLGLQYFVHFSAVEFLALVGVLCVVVPVALWAIRVGEAATLFIALTLFLIVSPTVLPDNYLWLYPFGTLLLLQTPGKRPTLSSLLMTNGLVFVGVFLVNFWIGQGYQAGLFFWGYPVFHANILFIQSALDFARFLVVYNIATFLVALFTVIYAVVAVEVRFVPSRLLELPSTPSPPTSGHERPSPGTAVVYQRPSSARSGSGYLPSALLAFLLILAAVGLVYNYTLPNQVDSSNVDRAPALLFHPQFESSGNFAMSIEGQTYTVSGPNIEFAPKSPAIGLYRSLEKENLAASLTFSVAGWIPALAPLLASPGVNVSAYNQTFVHLTGAESIPSAASYNLETSNETPDIQNFTNGSLYLDGNASDSYSFNGSNLSGQSLTLFYRITGYSKLQDIVFFMSNPRNTLELASIPSVQTLAWQLKGAKSWTSLNLPPQNISIQGWQFLSVTASPTTTKVDVNGLITTVPINWTDTSVDVEVGVPFAKSAFEYSFIGFVSKLISTPTPVSTTGVPRLIAQLGNQTPPIEGSAINGPFDLYFAGGPSGFTVRGPAFEITSNVSESNVTLGKLQDGNYSESITFRSIRIEQTGQTSFYLFPAIMTAGTPFLMLAAYGSFPGLEPVLQVAIRLGRRLWHRHARHRP
jgi:hypothetical protein